MRRICALLNRRRVFFEAKDAAAAILRAICAHPFENAKTVVQRMGEHMNLGVTPVDEFSVEPDLAIAVGEVRCRHHPAPGASGPSAGVISRPQIPRTVAARA